MRGVFGDDRSRCQRRDGGRSEGRGQRFKRQVHADSENARTKTTAGEGSIAGEKIRRRMAETDEKRKLHRNRDGGAVPRHRGIRASRHPGIRASGLSGTQATRQQGRNDARRLRCRLALNPRVKFCPKEKGSPHKPQILDSIFTPASTSTSAAPFAIYTSFPSTLAVVKPYLQDGCQQAAR